MATATRTTRAPAPLINGAGYPAVHRFTVEQYHQMIETGILKEDDQVELLNGWIVEKMPPNPPHSQAVRRLTRRLTSVLGDEWVISVQDPATMTQSEPQPDLLVAHGPEDRYGDRHPGPQDIVLVVEVADSSLPDDRTTKLSIYALARIPVYWIVNLSNRCVEVYTRPRGGKSPTYRNRQDYGPADSVPVVLARKNVGSIPVREILPR